MASSVAPTPASHPIPSEISIVSLSSPSHSASECRQGFSGQVIRGYYKDAGWLWVRNVNDPQVSSARGSPDCDSRSIHSGPILSRVRKNLLDLGFRDLVLIDVWHLGLGMDVVSNTPNLSFVESSGLTTKLSRAASAASAGAVCYACSACRPDRFVMR